LCPAISAPDSQVSSRMRAFLVPMRLASQLTDRPGPRREARSPTSCRSDAGHVPAAGYGLRPNPPYSCPRLRIASVRSLSALRRMKPSASFWS
jgi:hypothetical protein